MNSSWVLLAVVGILLASFGGTFLYRTSRLSTWGARAIMIFGYAASLAVVASAQGGDARSIAVGGFIGLIAGIFAAFRLVPVSDNARSSQTLTSFGPGVVHSNAANPDSEANFTFTPTANDYIQCTAAAFRRRLPGLWLGGVFVAFMLVLGVVGKVTGRQVNGEPLDTLLFIVLPIIFLTVPLLWRYNLKHQVEAHERLLAECRYQVNDAGWTITNKFSETKLDWGTYDKVMETRTHFLVFYSTSPNTFQIVPKRALTSEDAVSDLRDMLIQHMPLSQCKHRRIRKRPEVE